MSVPQTTILAVDPGASCGFAVVKVSSEAPARTSEVVAYGYIDVDTSSSYVGDWCIDLTNQIEKLATKHNITEIAIEDYFFSRKTRSGANINPAYRTAIHIWARQRGIHYEVVGISAWKVYVSGRSSPTREQKKQWGAKANKLMIVDALWRRHGIRFPNHSISEKTGKPLEFRLDCADAVGQGVYAAFARYNCVMTKCSVPVPPDITFRSVKKRYTYPPETAREIPTK